MASLQLQQENEKLKEQLSLCQKKIGLYKEQLNKLQKQSQSNKGGKLHKLSHKAAPSHHRSRNIVNSINRNDAANALMAKFAAKKSASKPPKPSKPKHIIEGSTNPKDAANALLSKFGALKKPKPSTASNPIKIFKKYDIMLKVGVDLSGVLTQMRKDNIDKRLIAEFNKSHGGTDSDDIEEESDPIKLGLPSKPAIKPPKQSMKRLHWNPIKLQKIKHSIWYKVDQVWNDYKSMSFELKFQTRTQKPKLSNDALKHNVNESELKQEEMVKFVSDKRSQQVQIGLRSYHMTNEALRNMILSLDDSKLELDNLSGLIDIIPTPDEQLSAEKASHDHNIANFGVAERFFYSLYDIMELGPRFKKWLWKLQFDGLVDKVEKQMVIMERAKLAITKSGNLKNILSIVLAFGNHMNYGNKTKANCYGFRLNDLSLLPQIKTFDNSMTFPMYLYDFIEKYRASLFNVFDELSILSSASNIEVDNVEKSYEELVNELKDLDGMIDRYNEEYFEALSDDDLFLKQMSLFQEYAKKKIWALKFKHNAFQKSQTQMMDYFAYDSDDKCVNLTKILRDLYAFIKMLESSKSKLDDLEKQRKKRNAKKLRQRKRRKSNECILNKNNSNIVNAKKRISKTFAIGLDDVGTPLAPQIGEMKMAFPDARGLHIQVIDDEKEDGISLQIDNNNSIGIDIPPSPSLIRSKTYSNLPKTHMQRNNIMKKTKVYRKHNVPKLNLNAIRPRSRGNSDPRTPNTPLLSMNKLRIKSNQFGIGLMTSGSTPCGPESHANVTMDEFGVKIDRNTSNYHNKSCSDIRSVRKHKKNGVILKDRRKMAYKRVPAKQLPKTPAKFKKKPMRNY